jgi:hypothetical protein
MQAVVLIAIIILSACHRPVETKQNHYIHKGEHAVISVDGLEALLHGD